MTYIEETTSLQRELFKLSETMIPLEEVDTEDMSMDRVYEVLDSNFEKVIPFVEETVDRWNTRTQIVKGINQNAHQMAKHGAKTILEQVSQLAGDSKAVERTQ